MPTLYRQYRPQTFGSLSGQSHITASLKGAFEKNRLVHAYLFHGPRGTGKTTTARIVAKRLNCEKAADAEPCGKCKLCQATQEGRNLDLIEIDAASNRGIDDIRALKDTINLSPAMGKYKVYIIDEVHMLTGEAFTALLKTLEEPTAHAVFILATTELHKVPDTIVSRCQVYQFHRATPAQLSARLQYLLNQEKRTADTEALTDIAARTDGSFRDAEVLLGQLLTLHDGNVTAKDVSDFLGLPPREQLDAFLKSLVEGEANAALTTLQTVMAGGYDIEQFLKECIISARDGAVAVTSGQPSFASFTSSPRAASRLPGIVRALLQALQDLAYVPQPIIAVELAVLTVCPTTAPPVQAPSPSVLPRPKKREQTTSTSSIRVEQIKAAWPELLKLVKQKNPVAATFLRAIEPVSVVDNTVRLRATYVLHRNFFDKPENKQMLEELFSSHFKMPLVILCYTELPTSGQSISWATKAANPEQDLLAAVKEVFGKK